MTQKISVYNHRHLGDCLHSIHFLNHLVRNNQVKCEFSCNVDYHRELYSAIDNLEKIELFPVEKSGEHSICVADICYDLENDGTNRYPYCCEKNQTYEDVILHIFLAHKHFSQKMGLIFPFSEKKQVMYDFFSLNENIFEKKYDCVLVNSEVKSGQVNFSAEEQSKIFSIIINKLITENLTFITTHKHGTYPSTTDNDLRLTQIGSIAKSCKFVIGVPTSPFWVCANKYSIENKVKFFNVTQDCCTLEIEDLFTTFKGSTSYIIDNIEKNLSFFLK